MSENLSLGEIRRIWRLCIDHLLTGRKFEQGRTESFLKMEPFKVDVLEDMRGRVEDVIRKAGEIELNRSHGRSVGFVNGHNSWNRPTVESDETVKLIEELKALIG